MGEGPLHDGFTNQQSEALGRTVGSSVDVESASLVCAILRYNAILLARYIDATIHHLTSLGVYFAIRTIIHSYHYDGLLYCYATVGAGQLH